MSNFNLSNLVPVSYDKVAKGTKAIKVGNQIFTFQNSMEFYKCATVYSPKTVSGFIVSGAGTVAVNGNYLPTDLKTEDGDPIYKHESNQYYCFERWGEKGICTTYDTSPFYGLYYYDTMTEKWDCNSDGAQPAPTVTAGDITINADVQKTWDGYKAVLTDGVYTFEDTVTTGLVYGDGFIPEAGKIYDADAKVIIANLFGAYPTEQNQ